MKSVFKGSILFVIGYLLSPLSFWNDLFVNIPIAYAFGFLIGLISSKLFLPAMILGYWITNLAGFLMMHYGALEVLNKADLAKRRRDLIINIAISVVYTAAIFLLVKMGWLKFPLEYFKH